MAHSYLPGKQNYSLMKGELFAKAPSESVFRSVGEVPSFTWSPQVETIDHYSSRSGVRIRDAQIITEIGAEISITTDESTIQNLAYALQGTISGYTQTQATGATVSLASVSAGEAIDIGLLDITGVSATADAGATDLVNSVDYQVFAEGGAIRFLKDFTDVEVTYDAPEITAADGRSFVEMLAQTGGVTVDLLFVGRNQQGRRYRVDSLRVDLRPSGSVGFISDEIAQIELTGTAVEIVGSSTPWGRAMALN